MYIPSCIHFTQPLQQERKIILYIIISNPQSILMGTYIQKFGMKNDTDPHVKQSLNYCLALRAYRNYSPDEIFVLL